MFKYLYLTLFLVAAASSVNAQIDPLPNTCLCYVEPTFEQFDVHDEIIIPAWDEIIYNPPTWVDRLDTLKVSPDGKTISDACSTCVVDVPGEIVIFRKRVKTKDEFYETIFHEAIVERVPLFRIKHPGGFFNVPKGECINGIFKQ